MNALRLKQWMTIILVAALSVEAMAQRQAFGRRVFPGGGGGNVGPGGVVSLPFMVNDNQGNNWRLYQNGWLQQQGNMPLYSQGAMLMVNGNQPANNNNQARVDEKTGEVVFENMAVGGFMVTRRVLIDRETAVVRYIDIIKNTAGQEQEAQLQIQSNLNYGINNSTIVPDPKKKDHSIAWVAQTGAGPSVVEVFAGKGSKLAPQINAPQGNSFVQSTLSVSIGAGKEIAILHLHTSAPSQEEGIAFVNSIKESDLLKNIPREIRKLIINFRAAQGIIGDVEILRGDLLDVVELKSGDQFKGTLKEKAFTLQTFYGPIEMPVDQVIGLINVGRFRPRQLMVTGDGQIFGGELEKKTIDLQLSSGQVTQIPLSQISRVGYRKREGEPEEWIFEKPLVLMRSGERVGVMLPADPVEVVTRYGKLTLPPDAIAAIAFQSEEHGVHDITLVDGSRFAGLLSADQFNMKLDVPGGATGADDVAAPQVVKFPASSIARLQFTNKVAENDDDASTIQLANDDLLMGTLTGQIKLDTAFDTITVNATEIRTLEHSPGAGLDVSVVLWDGTTLSGQVQDHVIPAQLAGGVKINIPVTLLVRYEQPQPQPSAQMVERIKGMIARLNADDWKERDRAEQQLVSMGPVASGVLKKLRENQPPEAQQRIDSILKELEKQRAAQKAGRAAVPAGQQNVADFGGPGRVINN